VDDKRSSIAVLDTFADPIESLPNFTETSEDSSEEVTERVRRFLEKRSKCSSAALSLEIDVRLWPRRCCDPAGIFLPPIRDSLTFRWLFIFATMIMMMMMMMISLSPPLPSLS
jgi:hypothetical protein